MLKYLKKYRKIISAVLSTAGIFAFAFTVLAAKEPGMLDYISSPLKTSILIFGTIIEYIVSALGQITVILVHLLIKAAQYNEFVDSPAVTEGWVIVRDVVNMFFIVILLVIAFGTIFNVRNYTYQAMLPRLLIMAVVINFSRTIAGIFIDFGQVVMLTFVNGFQAAAGGNFVNALRINELLELNKEALTLNTDVGSLLIGYILALIAMVITAIVIGIMLVVLIMRIVALQFLIVLSPLAFLASVWPSGKVRKSYDKWWDMFIDNITIGPIFAFFLWLSLLVLGSGTVADDFKVAGTTYGGEVENFKAGPTEFGTPESMMSYVFGIGMLMMSLYMAKNLQAAGSGMVGQALGKIQGYAKKGVMGVARLPARGAKAAVGAAYEKTGARAYKEAFVSKVQTSKFGKAVGLGTKEFKDIEKAKRSERALRATGQTSKADSLRERLESAEQKSLKEKNLTTAQLKEKFGKTTSGSYEYAAMARELADRGEITENREFERIAGGDKRLESTLRYNAHKAGVKSAMIGYAEKKGEPPDIMKQTGVAYRGMRKDQREDWYKNIAEDVALGPDGKMNNEFAAEKLATVDRGDFEKFSKARQEQIIKAMADLEKNAPDKFKSLNLQEKRDNLRGGVKSAKPPGGTTPSSASGGAGAPTSTPKRPVGFKTPSSASGAPPIVPPPSVPPTTPPPATPPPPPSTPPATPTPAPPSEEKRGIEEAESAWDDVLKEAGIEIAGKNEEPAGISFVDDETKAAIAQVQNEKVREALRRYLDRSVSELIKDEGGIDIEKGEAPKDARRQANEIGRQIRQKRIEKLNPDFRYLVEKEGVENFTPEAMPQLEKRAETARADVERLEQVIAAEEAKPAGELKFRSRPKDDIEDAIKAKEQFIKSFGTWKNNPKLSSLAGQLDDLQTELEGAVRAKKEEDIKAISGKMKELDKVLEEEMSK